MRYAHECVRFVFVIPARRGDAHATTGDHIVVVCDRDTYEHALKWKQDIDSKVFLKSGKKIPVILVHAYRARHTPIRYTRYTHTHDIHTHDTHTHTHDTHTHTIHTHTIHTRYTSFYDAHAIVVHWTASLVALVTLSTTKNRNQNETLLCCCFSCDRACRASCCQC